MSFIQLTSVKGQIFLLNTDHIGKVEFVDGETYIHASGGGRIPCKESYSEVRRRIIEAQHQWYWRPIGEWNSYYEYVEWVLVCIKDVAGYSVHEAIWNPDRRCFTTADEKQELTATHWMPLPPTPKEMP